jgi:proteasome lid subunit RPN8/RPN11
MSENKLLEKAFEELGPSFKKLIEEHVPKFELFEQTEEDAFDDADAVIEYLREVGTPICADDEGHLYLGKVAEPCIGAGCRISSKCPVGSKVGSFHTHPLVGVWPSYPDIMTSTEEHEILFCIGGRMADDKPYAACYVPTGKPFYADPFKPMYHFSEEPAESIRFWRGEPEADAEYLLEIFSDADLASEFGDYYDVEGSTPEEIGAEIRKIIERDDELPPEYNELADSSEGEWDELDSYSPEQGERLMEEAFKRLALFFNAKGKYL